MRCAVSVSMCVARAWRACAQLIFSSECMVTSWSLHEAAAARKAGERIISDERTRQP